MNAPLGIGVLNVNEAIEIGTLCLGRSAICWKEGSVGTARSPQFN